MFLASLLLLTQARSLLADDSSHKYANWDKVVLYVNKVGPYNNPQETYNYFSLPFCSSLPKGKAKHKWGGLGEVLQGNELIESGLDIRFRVDVAKTGYCKVHLDDDDVEQFTMAVDRHYWFELFMDDLPIWGFVGESGKSAGDAVMIYTHKSFEIGYNGPNIISVNLTNEEPVPVLSGAELQFSYSVRWVQSQTPFVLRFRRYLDEHFFEHQIHWFSVLNSFLMVLFLVGLVSMILMRTLRKDYQRYMQNQSDLETLEKDMGEESGWKLVHGDVFRPPKRLALLAALVGTGAQLAVLVLLVILITIFGVLYEDRGSILTAFIVCYALTSFVGGYVSGSLYKQHEGKNWISCMMMTAVVYPWSTFAIAFVLNTIAIFYQSLAAVPFGSMVVLVLLWGFLALPMCMMGSIAGKNLGGTVQLPCRVKRIPSPIPSRAWYFAPAFIVMVGGLLPFGSIFIEMYFIFTSFWNYKVYYVYGFMLLVFLMLLIVTLCSTVVATYFLLNAENYNWPWTAFCTAASTAVYVFLYAVHYFIFKTKMTGFFQTAFYFGHSLIFCIGLGTLTGSMGFLGARQFILQLYSGLKCD